MFSENDIVNLYNEKIKLPESYFKKYEKIPTCPVKAYNYNWNNTDFPRNWCILDFIDWIKKYDIKEIDELGYTCDSDPELEFLSYKNKTNISYPKYDLHTIGNYFSNKFDFFLFSQTLEHLYNPYESVKNIYNIVKKNGYVFTSVPTINIPHMTPIHFTGFTPMGLAMLFKIAGFEIIDIGQWGNYDYINKAFSSHSWPGYNDLHNNGFISNEERNVCQCWILAKKI
jgi:SAM-dependent methyltransferase